MNKINPTSNYLVLIFICTVLGLRGQFIPTFAPGYISTSPTNQGVGIGNFPNATPTNARLHVNNFYCNQPSGPLQNFLFRTDGGQGNVNMWQMYTGTAANTVTEKARLFIDPLSLCAGITSRNNG